MELTEPTYRRDTTVGPIDMNYFYYMANIFYQYGRQNFITIKTLGPTCFYPSSIFWILYSTILSKEKSLSYSWLAGGEPWPEENGGKLLKLL